MKPKSPRMIDDPTSPAVSLRSAGNPRPGDGGHSMLGKGGDAQKWSRILALTLGALLLMFVAGCASDGKPDRPAGHRWYQGDMDNDERAFFLDSFSDR